MKMIPIAFSLLLLFSCVPDQKTHTDDDDTLSISYLALGDSYTIGESVQEEERFPYLLIHSDFVKPHTIKDYKVIAKTGWTTRNLLDAMDKEDLKINQFDFITLLIGVNNQYQGKPFLEYEEELRELFERAIYLLNGNADKLIVVSIPDYSVTPFASSRDTVRIASEIKKYNDFKKELAESFGARFVYITDLTQNAKNDLSLLAGDQLHYSAKSHGQWVSRIVPEVNEIIKTQ